jgi:hypothetical protein
MLLPEAVAEFADIAPERASASPTLPVADAHHPDA